MPTVQEIISIAKISQYLAANDYANSGLFGGGRDRLLSRKLYGIRKNVEWLYGLDSTDETLIKTSNYLYALCAPYNSEAALIAGDGSGGIIINPSTGVPASLVEIRLQFVIGESGSLMNAGDTTLVLNYENILSGSLLIFLDGTGELPTNRTDRISYSIFYGTTSSAITFNQPVATGQLYIIRFVQILIASAASGSGGDEGGVFIGDL